MSEEESWKGIPDYKNYEINNKGQIKSVRTGNIISETIDKRNKRLTVNLCKNGFIKCFYVDYLVALVFKADKQFPVVKNYVFHIDGYVSNISTENVDWKFQGTTYNPNLKKWIAQILVNHVRIYLGSFHSQQEAG